jgi:propionyl-CoA carboxylase alpha chain
MFKKILIANRGEIAVRIMETCRKMGIQTVAVYSEADANALHVKAADEAVYLGPAPSSQSYLNVPALVKAIQKTGADAVHPGYGFLSENNQFCAAVKKAGAVFIGPEPHAIEVMGDKIESKKLAKSAGVSTVPGTEGAVESQEEAEAIVKEIGFPVMIKAAAGGGGKGMRVARNDKELVDGLKYAASEAQSSFSDSRVFIEKFFENPRHIEIQVLADKHGNCIALGERECSIQRRHQKIIEEAPSSFLSEEMRKTMQEQSVALAKAVDYCSAGTVEYIVDPDGTFAFLEMNTRLQVEHRVTELITNIDLVEQMIRIAAGEELSITQEDVKLHGWAFESRVYAEDPKRGFLPSTGRVTRYQEPEGNRVLVDSGVYEGGEVSMYYDPMIAKVCTHASSRDKAIDAMQKALGAYVIHGITTNMGFMQAVYSHDRFREGDISTNFIEQEYPEGFSGAEITDQHTRIFIGAAVFLYLKHNERAAQTSHQLPGRARSIGTSWVVSIGEKHFPVRVKEKEFGYDIALQNEHIVVRSSYELGNRLFQGSINGEPVSVHLRYRSDGYRLIHAGAEALVSVHTSRVAELAKYMPEVSSAENANELAAPIAGLVISIPVEEGEEIKAGQELIVVEAMKMENVIYAERDVTIKEVHVTENESVSADQVMISFMEE